MTKLNLDDLKEIELNLLIYFAKFCDDNKLSYYLSYGTLLGSVRHAGFIPWDDDIDVCMPRPDYEKLIQLQKSFDTDEIKMCKLGDKGYVFPFMKVENKNTVVKEHDARTSSERGVWIDIFPVDGFIGDESKIKIKFNNALRRVKLVQKSQAMPGKIGRNIIFRLLNYFLIPLSWIYVNGTRMLYRWDRIGKQVNFIEANRIGDFMWTIGYKDVFDKNVIFPLKKGTFCGKEFWIPNNSDKYLTQIYGNYMQLPPVEERTSHLEDAWKK